MPAQIQPNITEYNECPGGDTAQDRAKNLLWEMGCGSGIDAHVETPEAPVAVTFTG